MSSSVLLLDPLRSALLMMGISEQFLSVPQVVDLYQTPTYLLGSQPLHQRAILELLVLFDELQIIHHEEPGDVDKLRERGVETLSVLPLQAAGLVTFDGAPLSDTEIRLPTDSSAESFWQLNMDIARQWTPMLIDYVVSKGHVPSRDFARVYLEDMLALQQQTSTSYPGEIHVAFMSALGELLQAERIIESSGAACAHIPLTHPEPGSDHEMTHQIFEIVLDELLAKELSLPLPSSLGAALQLRSDPNIRAFREVFQPWVDRLRSGDLAEEVRLRREVQQAVRAFRNALRIERLNKILAYVALPVGFIPTIEGVVAGVALGITGIGLSHLAERWQSQSKWLGLTRRAT